MDDMNEPQSPMDDNRQDGEDEQRMLRQGLGVLAVSWLMVLAIVGFWLIGVWIDRRLGTWPLASIVLVIIGTAGGAYQSYRLIMKSLKSRDRRD